MQYVCLQSLLVGWGLTSLSVSAQTGYISCHEDIHSLLSMFTSDK